MRIDEPTSILVFRNGSIGNTLVALPALLALKRRFPDTKLSVVLDSTGAELLRYCPFIDQIITYDKRGKDKGFFAHLKLLRTLRSLHPSHAILFKRFFRNGMLAYLCGATYRIGFVTNGKASFLNHTIHYDETVHIAELNMTLLSLLGIQDRVEPYRILLNSGDGSEARRLLEKSIPEGKRFAVIHYGGSTTRADFFSTEKMKQLLQPLIESEIELVFIGSGKTEKKLAEAAIFSLGHGRLLFDLPIRIMASVIAEAICFIGFNSGPAHVATGVGTPGIVIYRPDANVESEIHKWKPLGDLTPFIPPFNEDASAWHEFLLATRQRIIALISNSATEQR